MFIIKDSCFEASFEAFQTVQLCSQYSFLFQLNTHSMLSTFIASYHLRVSVFVTPPSGRQLHFLIQK